MAEQQLEKRLKLGWSWFSRPVPLLAASAAVALAGAFVAATDLPPELRALAALLGVAAVTAAGGALRWREHRFLAKAAEIALRSAKGERSSPAAKYIPSPALASVARALHEAGDAIAAREAQFALLARATGDAVWDWDLDTDLVACSTGGKSVLGGEAEAFVQPFSWWQERVHPDDRGPLEAMAADIRSGAEKLYSKEYRFLHADGNYRSVWDRGVIVEDGSGRAVRIVGCMTDISDRKAAEDMLRHVERRQHALITAVSSIVWRDELGAEVQPRNPAWEDYTGQSQEEEFGKGWLDVVHPEDREGMRQAWSTAMQNGTVYQADIRLRRRDGSYRWMSARGAPVRDSAGKLVEYIGLYQDVDDYRRLHAAGVSIALDDFGTGYASLTHLQQYPVDVIKIDQSFIRSIGTDSGSQAITSAVLGLGRSLGMTVIAEGIETAEQAALLTAAGCDGGQGYHFARPMPASEVPIFLRSWRGLDAAPDRNVASAA